MATIVLRNGWNEPENYNATSVTFLDPNGNEVTFYENGTGGGGTGGVGVQADWAQINPYHPSYIKNRPFYVYYDAIVEPNAKNFEVDAHNLYVVELQLEEPIIEGQDYIVYWRENGYLCKAKLIEGDLILGDASLIKEVEQEEDPEPFVGYFVDGVNKLIIGTPEQTSLELVGLFSSEEKIQVIDKKFLPDDIVGLDEEALAKYLTDKKYVTEEYVTKTLTEFEKKIPSIEGLATIKYVNEEIKKLSDKFVDYATIEWVKENYATSEQLLSAIEMIANVYATKTELAEVKTALENYKEEVNTKFQETQADWDIEDESDLAAIKNKPFGIYPDIIPITDDLAPASFEAVEGGYQASLGIVLDSEKKYTLLWNDTVIPCELGISTAEGITLNADGTVFVTVLPEEEVKLGLRLTDNIYCLDTKFLKKDEILEGMASQQYVEEQIEAIPQADWDVDISSNKSYIKNRPFYLNEVKFQSNLTFTKSSHNNNYQCPISFPLDGQLIVPGQKFTVVWDGITYPDCIVRRIELIKSSNREITTVGCVIGNSRLWETSKISVYEDDYEYICSDLPFCMQINNYAQVGSNELDLKSVVTKSTNSSHSLLIYRSLKKIDKIFLPKEALKEQEQADWTETDSSSPSFIKHKPEIAEQKHSNWTQTNPYDITYIQNKPFGENDDLMGEHELDFVYDEEVQAWIADLNVDLGLEDLYDNETSVIITWDGQKHTQAPAQGSWYAEGLGYGAVFASLGNTSIIPRNPIVWKVSTSSPSGTSLPYLITSENKIYTYEEGTSHKVGIVLTTKTSGKRLDKKWLPTDIVYDDEYLQPNWNQTNTKAKDYIRNKPEIPTLVQPDWAQTDSTQMDYIKNKPDFSAIQADWAVQDETAPNYIQNIPTSLRKPEVAYERANYVVKNGKIDTDFINTNWEETNPLNSGYIFNKPFGDNLSLFKGTLNKSSSYDEASQQINCSFATAQLLPLPIVGKTYKIVINNVVYTAKAKSLSLSFEEASGCYFGNAYLLDSKKTNTGENYFILITDEYTASKWYAILCCLKTPTNPGDVYLEINENNSLKKIDKKYLPDECFNGASKEQVSALEKLVQAQSELITQMQQQIQNLTKRVEKLEQGQTSTPEATVNGEILEVEGTVTDETLILSGGVIDDETLGFGGSTDNEAEVQGENLVINGTVVGETLAIENGLIINEQLELAGDSNTSSSVEGEDLTLSGSTSVVNETLTVDGVAYSGVLDLDGENSVAIVDDVVTTSGEVDNDILDTTGVVTANETWEV